MTERLYYTDSDLLDFKAKVIAVEQKNGKYAISLDRTAFYPTSGGQLFDTGLIGDSYIIDVLNDNETILHISDEKPAFSAGDTVEGHVNRKRRRDNMQKHTAQHILSQAFLRTCQAKTISAHLGEDYSTIDLDSASLTREDLYKTEALANEIVFENREVKVDFILKEKLKDFPLRKIPKRGEGLYRVVIISDYDWTACGGTHCKRTGSVGLIKITDTERIRGNIRLHFLTGFGAVEDYRWRFEEIEQISKIFTRHGKESVDAVRALLAERDAYKSKYLALKREMLPIRIESWISDAKQFNDIKIVVLDFSDEEFDEAKTAALGITSRYKAIALINVQDKFLVAVSEDIEISAVDILRNVATHCGGKGGGSSRIAQGGGFRVADLKVLLAQPEKLLDI